MEFPIYSSFELNSRLNHPIFIVSALQILHGSFLRSGGRASRLSRNAQDSCSSSATASKERYDFTWAAHELSKAFIDVSRGAADLVSIKKPKSIQISVSDRTGRRVVIHEIGAERRIDELSPPSQFPLYPFSNRSVSSTGYPTLTLRRERANGRAFRHRNAVRIRRAVAASSASFRCVYAQSCVSLRYPIAHVMTEVRRIIGVFDILLSERAL